MNNIADLLRETREEAGIDLKEVSNDLEIDELALMNIEEGKIGAFKDISLLKEYIAEYAKYLGLDATKIVDGFNEYLFEYTSRIPVKEIEKEIKQKEKDNTDKIVSPYTLIKPKNQKLLYVLIYVLILILVVLAIIWSVSQITIDKTSAYVISYRK